VSTQASAAAGVGIPYISGALRAMPCTTSRQR
jgi:hypothetical protein